MTEPGSATRSRAAAGERDAAWVRRCLDGDEDAWCELVRCYSPLVWAVARKRGLSDADAADVHGTVWRIAVQDLTRLRKAESVGGWLARTADLQALRVIRGYCIQRRALDRIPVREEDKEQPSDVLGALEDRRRVGAALAQVGDRCQRLLRLLYFQNPTPSYAHISGALDMPIGSIGPTRARCLGRLEQELGRDFDE